MDIRRVTLGLTLAFGGTLFAASWAGAEGPPPQHLRGSVDSLQDHVLAVKTARGEQKVAFADTTKVFQVSRADISAVADGRFVGITSVEKNGHRVAVEVHIFDESLRGLGEGHYPWDLDSGPNMMTNANIAKVESVGADRVLKLDYKGGSQTIDVPPDAQIVAFTAGSADELKPGAKVFVIARKADDGQLAAGAVVVGKDGLKPPM